MFLIETITCPLNIFNNIQHNLCVPLKIWALYNDDKQKIIIFSFGKMSKSTNFRDNPGHKCWHYLQILLIMTSSPPPSMLKSHESCRAMSVLHKHQHWKGSGEKSFLIFPEITECQHIMTMIVYEKKNFY